MLTNVSAYISRTAHRVSTSAGNFFGGLVQRESGTLVAGLTLLAVPTLARLHGPAGELLQGMHHEIQDNRILVSGIFGFAMGLLVRRRILQAAETVNRRYPQRPRRAPNRQAAHAAAAVNGQPAANAAVQQAVNGQPAANAAVQQAVNGQPAANVNAAHQPGPDNEDAPGLMDRAANFRNNIVFVWRVGRETVHQVNSPLSVAILLIFLSSLSSMTFGCFCATFCVGLFIPN